MRRYFPLLLLPLACSLLSAEPAGTIPQSEIGALYQRAKSMPRERDERVALNSAIIEDGRKCLEAHPDVKPEDPSRDLLVRRVMLPAAERLQSEAPSPEHREQLKTFATEVATSAIYEAHRIEVEKPRAGMILAHLEIYPNDDGQPVDAAKHIRAFVASFPPIPTAQTPDALTGQAIVYAAQLAVDAKEQGLADEYSKVIVEKYLAVDNAISALIAAGHAPVFEAEMTTLDDKKISFPADTKGKVLVLDFWATWCGPCVASMPHIKTVYDKYKNQDVMIIGVSCDVPSANETPESNKEKVATFVSAKGYEWSHTWSGEWPKAGKKYGVNSLPTVFIIGKDGKIITTKGRGREEFFIQQALKATVAP